MIEQGSRIVAYEPNGARIGPLPWPLAWSATVPHGELGAATLQYTRAVADGQALQRRLTDGLEIALEEWDGTKWVEPAGCRFVVVQRSLDFADQTDTVSIQATAYGWLLSKIKHAAPDETLYAADGDNAGRRQFLDVTAGTVIATLLDEYVERGGPRIERDFTTQADSDGKPWPKLNSLWVSRGEALDVTLGRLADRGDIDWHFQGRKLVVTPPQPGRDFSNEIALHVGTEISEAPSEETIADLITAHTVHGGEGLIVTDADTSAPSPWGRWEGFASDDRITTEGGARARNQQILRDSARLRGQYTRDLTPLCQWRLGIDIVAGDWITAPTWRAGERVRVASTLWRGGTDGVTRSLILNDSLLDRELRRLRKERLGESGGADGSGTTIQPALDGTDKRTPAQVQGLSLATQAYIAPDGAARGLVVAAWSEVSTATPADGSGALEVERYEIATRPNVTGSNASIILSTQELTAEWGDLEPGSEIAVKVRARGRYATSPGVWSAEQVVVVADDVTPPPVPSDLAASSSNGVAIFDWDGLTHQGQPQPLDFVHMIVEWEGFRDGAAVTGSDLLIGSGRTHVPQLDRGSTARARGKSVDRSGNESEWSSWVSVEVRSVLDDADLDAQLESNREAVDGLSADVTEVRDELLPPMQQAIEAADTKLTEHEQSLQDQHNDLAELREAAVTGTTVEYAVGASETTPPTSGWSTSMPTRTPGSFIWMRTLVEYGNGGSGETAPVLVTGNAGPVGPPGEDGTSVQITGRVANQAALPTSLGPSDAGKGWVTENDGHLHVWSGAGWTDVGLIRGPQGEDGADGNDGVSVTSVTTLYRRSATTPATPTGSTPSGWSVTEPGYLYGLTLYRTERIGFSNGQVAYTVPTRVSADAVAGKALEARRGFATYEWDGDPHASPAVERLSGVEARRNLIENPSFELGASPYGAGSGASFSRASAPGAGPASGSAFLSVTLTDAHAGNGHVHVRFPIPVVGVAWLGVSLVARNSGGITGGAVYVQFFSGGSSVGGLIPVEHWGLTSAANSQQQRRGGVVPIPATADGARIWLRASGSATEMTAPGSGIMHTDAWMAVATSSEAEAWAQLDLGYFDGDTADGAGAQQLADLDHDLGEVRLSANRRNQVIHNLLPPYGEVHPDTGEPLTTGDVWWQVDTLGPGRVTLGQWAWDGTGWRSATIGHEVINSVDVNDLNVYGTGQMNIAVIDKLWTDGLFAKTGLFNRAIISSTDNILPGVDDLRSVDSTPGITSADLGFGASAFGINGSDPSFWVRGQASPETNIPFQLQAGTKYRVSVDSRSTVSGTRFYWQFVAQSGQDLTAGGASSHVFSNTITGPGWRTHTTEYTPAESGLVVLKVYANHRTGAPNPDGYQWFRNARIMPMTGATHIENGAVRTNHVGAEEIVGTHIYMDEGFAVKIAGGIADFDSVFAGFVKATMIDTEALDFKQATGLEITSGVFRTTPTANRGVIIDTGGLRAYNSSGALTAQITGNSGSITGWTITGGRVQTASTGSRIMLTSSTNPNLWIYDSSNRIRVTLGMISGNPGMTMRDANDVLRLGIYSSGAINAWSPAGRLSFMMQTQDVGTYGRLWITGPDASGATGSLVMGSDTIDGTGTQTVRLRISGTSASDDRSDVLITNGGAWHMGSTTRGFVRMLNNGAVDFYSRANLFRWYGLPETTLTGQPVTMVVGSGGSPLIYRNTSVRAAKVDICDVTVDPELVLDVPVREWTDRNAWERKQAALDRAEAFGGLEAQPLEDQAVALAPLPRVPGIVAEELEEAGLGMFCSYSDGELVGVQYDRVALLLIPLVRDLRDRLNRLEETIHD